MKSLYSRASRFEGRASKFCWATCPRASASKMYLSPPEHGLGNIVFFLNWENREITWEHDEKVKLPV